MALSPAILLAVVALSMPLCATGREIVVASYNLANYVGDEVADESSGLRAKPKTEAAIAATVSIIKEVNPDVLGVCEMGDAEQFASFQQRLAEAGLGYEHSEYVAGPDPDRHLALLSRLPIVKRQSRPYVTFGLAGVPQKVRRGFLDVTVQVNSGYALRLVGVHLKSKLASVEGEALVRRHEAQLLRKHAERILQTEPATNLLLYGDFNEQKNEPAIQEIAGPRGTPMHLDDLALRDSVGDRWTHYWKTADVYARIDYFFASRGLVHEIISARSGIHRSERWNEASDHRLIYTTIVAEERP